MRSSMSSRWHKNGTCYGSAHPVANTEWLIWVNQSHLESVVVPGKRSPQLCKNTHPSMLCLHNQGPGRRVTWAGNPPPPRQVNKAGTPFCYCCGRNSCLSHSCCDNGDQWCVKRRDNGGWSVFGWVLLEREKDKINTGDCRHLAFKISLSFLEWQHKVSGILYCDHLELNLST